MQDAFVYALLFRMVYFMDKKSRNNALIAHAIEENVSRFFLSGF